MKRYKLLVCGATFDSFHKGHEEFLRHALSLSDRVFLGLTSDAYVTSIKRSEGIQSYNSRKQNVIAFLKTLGEEQRVEIQSIDSVYIPQVWEHLPIDVILVTKDSRKGAIAINLKRKREGKIPLKILIAPLFLAEDSKPVSATRIRNGEVDREGNLYIKPLWPRKQLALPSSLRPVLKKPFGKIGDVEHDDLQLLNPQKLLVVGDVTARLFLSRGVVPAIAAIDFSVERRRIYQSTKDLGFLDKQKIIYAINPAGFVTPSLFRAVKKAFVIVSQNNHCILVIKGEDDLAVLPFILLAPLSFTIVYGQPQIGSVYVEITSETKKQASMLLQQFTIR